MNTKPSLYSRLLSAGVEVSNHHSDLYFPSTTATDRIVKESLDDNVLSSRPRVFRSNIDGRLMYEAAFQFDPYWDARAPQQEQPK